jgi:hypothetical protein
MARISTVVTTLSMLSLLLAPAAFAQMGMCDSGSCGWGMGGQYGRMYDSSTVETITGEVVSVDNQTSPMGGMSYGVHLSVETANGIIPVHLGPAWYLDRQDIQIEAGDQIEVTGSRVTLTEGSVIIAAEVHKGDNVLTLRDQNGFPVWSGWRRQ